MASIQWVTVGAPALGVLCKAALIQPMKPLVYPVSTHSPDGLVDLLQVRGGCGATVQGIFQKIHSLKLALRMQCGRKGDLYKI